MEEEGQRRSEQRERKRDTGCEARSTQEKPTGHTVHPNRWNPISLASLVRPTKRTFSSKMFGSNTKTSRTHIYCV